MSRYYYIDKLGWQQGPVEKERLKEIGISADTMVWGETMDGWKRADEVPEIAAMFNTLPKKPVNRPTGKPEMNYGRRDLKSGNDMENKQSAQPQRRYVVEKPSTYLWLGICTTILCCLPFGIVSIVYGAKVDSNWYAGRTDAAIDYSLKAKNWGIAAAVTGICVGVVYLLLIQAAILRY